MKKIIFILLLVIVIGGLFAITFFDVVKKEIEYYPKVESKLAFISNYNNYGRILNFEGVLKEKLALADIKNIKLILKSKDQEIPINIIYIIENNVLSFKTSNLINTGINLDNLAKGRYFLLLKIKYNDKTSHYYSFKNKSHYGNFDYYTITKNSKNNYITMSFVEQKKNSFVQLDINPCHLPKDVYDFVIDPGHGGLDSGATKGNIYEATVVLDISNKLKKELEANGYKIKLTREGSYTPGGDELDAYQPNGRVNMPHKVRAKYIFSIHLNSAPYIMKKGGVEIYSPNNADLTLASLLARNLVTYAKTTYSPNSLYRAQPGVYVRTFTNSEISNSIADANKLGYQPYNITNATPYLYIIRETGGLITHAYVDGRNKKYGKNEYYNSNVGLESYLIELGFMVNDVDLANLVNNKQGYALGLKEGIIQYFTNKK